jgi:hypothetical protein
MNLFRFAELVVLFLGALFLVTQVLLPALTGRPLVPILRRRRKLEAKLARARETKDERNLEKQIRKEER